MAGPDFGFRNLDFRFLILDLWLWIGPKGFFYPDGWVVAG